MRAVYNFDFDIETVLMDIVVVDMYLVHQIHPRNQRLKTKKNGGNFGKQQNRLQKAAANKGLPKWEQKC